MSVVHRKHTCHCTGMIKTSCLTAAERTAILLMAFASSYNLTL